MTSGIAGQRGEPARMVVTGAAGFIGSHLTEALLARGHHVVGIDSLCSYYDPARKRANLVAALESPRFRFVHADLTKKELEPLLDGVEVVFHLAGQPGVRVSWGKRFKSYLTDNVLATQRLLEAVRGAPGPRVVFASSSSVYGNADRYPVREEDPALPVSPYGATKLSAEHLCRLYGTTFGVPVVVLRYFSIYGPRQRPDMAFTRFIDALTAGTPLEVHGDGRQVRDFTFVDDAVAATLAAATSGRPGATYNVAGGHEASVREVIAKLAGLLGVRMRVAYGRALPGDPARSGADTSAARRDLGYRPSTELDDGLARQITCQLGALRAPAALAASA
jgi:UDP-glucuronate 4-epimerase